MSEKTPHRRPATFKLDDPSVIVIDPDDKSRPARGTVHVTPEPDPRNCRCRSMPRWFRAARLSLGQLVLGRRRRAGAARRRSWRPQPDRGSVCAQRGSRFPGLAFAVAATLALIASSAREAFGLARLATIEKLHLRATEVLASDDRAASRAIVGDLLKLAHQNPQLARARTALQSHADDIIDGADMIRLAERELMARSMRRHGGWSRPPRSGCRSSPPSAPAR